MSWFKPKQKWERTFRLRSNQSSGRSILAVLFWLWGVIGLFFNAGTLFGLTGSIGVGTSALLAATALIWIGSMVLFGIGALLARTDFDGERPIAEDYGDVRVTR
ncbi:hypothetical protein JQ582_42105 [Bradyrhizobium japonicum]|uniref:hypothetical protein n=1 Tax=Bradyrhizobium japonicum TaxID=375 RepID=UPI001BA7AABD|nr:hypothetical protein [Bradyrhizobium japonicum]MBR0728646.1 hypothetical protein [Bradyrhizobium japonicum]MBR0750492.1 hypothetical protein [Bradyrhizobium japonicum]